MKGVLNSVRQDINIGVGPRTTKSQPLLFIAGPGRLLLQDGSTPDQGLKPDMNQMHALLSSDYGPAGPDPLPFYPFEGELGPGLAPADDSCRHAKDFCPTEALNCRLEDTLVSMPSTVHGIQSPTVCWYQAVVLSRASESHQIEKTHSAWTGSDCCMLC